MLCFIIDDKNLESDFAFSKVFVNEKERGGGGGKEKGDASTECNMEIDVKPNKRWSKRNWPNCLNN